MKKIFYWAPFISDVATVKAVINSCIGFKKYNQNYETYIINCFGEFNQYQGLINKNNLKIIQLNVSEKIKKLPSKGFLFSRIKYLIIFIMSFKKLSKIIKHEEPDFFIAHLITSLPIILFKINKFKTKLVLRISGLPKLNLIRYFFWKICSNKISLITSPTKDTNANLIEYKIFDKNKIFFLQDPIFNINNIKRLRAESFNQKGIETGKFIVGIGRLTKQKNFELLINFFNKIKDINKETKLVILGNGEEEIKLKKLTKTLNLETRIFFLGYQKNVYKFLSNCKLFILTSKWEDPGFVLIEAAVSRANILSSDCPNGPKEFLEKNKSGYLFKSNNIQDLVSKYKIFLNLKNNEIKNLKLNALKQAKNYSIFYHTKKFTKILESLKS